MSLLDNFLSKIGLVPTRVYRDTISDPGSFFESPSGPQAVEPTQLAGRYYNFKWGATGLRSFYVPYDFACACIGPASHYNDVLIRPLGESSYLKVSVGAPLIGNYRGPSELVMPYEPSAFDSAWPGSPLEILFFNTIPSSIPSIRAPIRQTWVDSVASTPVETPLSPFSPFTLWVTGRKKIRVSINPHVGQAERWFTAYFITFPWGNSGGTSRTALSAKNRSYYVPGGQGYVLELDNMNEDFLGGGCDQFQITDSSSTGVLRGTGATVTIEAYD